MNPVVRSRTQSNAFNAATYTAINAVMAGSLTTVGIATIIIIAGVRAQRLEMINRVSHRPRDHTINRMIIVPLISIIVTNLRTGIRAIITTKTADLHRSEAFPKTAIIIITKDHVRHHRGETKTRIRRPVLNKTRISQTVRSKTPTVEGMTQIARQVPNRTHHSLLKRPVSAPTSGRSNHVK